MKLRVIGDIHGDLNKLKIILKELPNDLLPVFVGDYIDRGKYSLEVIQTLMGINGKFLLGNHDFEFLNSIKIFTSTDIELKDLYYDFVMRYQLETLRSFLKEYKKDYLVDQLVQLEINKNINFLTDENDKILTEIFNIINNNFKKEIKFLRNCLLRIETDLYVISHAGGNFQLPVNQNSFDAWIYARSKSKPVDPRIFIFGHTVTDSKKVEISDQKVNVDTGAIFYNVPLGYFDTEETKILKEVTW